MNGDSIILAGYRFFREGIAVWPGWRLRHRWDQLAAVTSFFRADRRGWQTIFVFTVGGSFKLGGTRTFTFGHGPGRYAEVLALACAHAPATAEIDELTRDLARWGPRAVRRRNAAVMGAMIGADGLIERARNQRAWLEQRRALKTVERVLMENPRCSDAHRLKVTLLGETGARPTALFVAADHWVNHCPDSREARTIRGIAGLRADVRSVAEEVAAWLRQEPAQSGLTSALGDYHFRHEEFDDARRLWERFAQATDDVGARRTAERNIDYLRRYATDPGFRWRERSKRYSTVAMVWLPLVLLLAVYGWRTYQAWHPAPPPPSNPRREKVWNETREKMAETDRWLRENTRLVAGTDAELRRRAAAGEAAAQYTRAFHLLHDSDKPDQQREGLALLEAAAAQDYRWAMLDLAGYLDEGRLLPKDESRALTLYEKAAELGSPRAACLAGIHYRKGAGVTADPAKAFALFERSAQGGNALGMAWAGYLLEHGEGTPQSLDRAVDYYRKAAEKKDPWAAEHLVRLMGGTEPVILQTDEWKKWAWVGAEAGSEKLQYLAALMLLRYADAPADKVNETLGWLEQQATAGNAVAARTRGYFPWMGVGVPFDAHEAVRWFSRAAAKNDATALSLLGQCYAFGLGVERDRHMARVLRDRLAALPQTASLVQDLDKALEAVGPLPAMEPVANMSPKPLFQMRPKYPMRWRRAGVEGEAVVEFIVDPEGFVRAPKVVRATAADFGAASVVSVACWRFQPARKDGRRVNTRMQVPIVFSLNGESSEEAPGLTDEAM